jgi:acyl-CoA synthetase (AMP-forming)/AMP-acid ligase II
MAPTPSHAASEVAVRPPHDTLVAAFEAAARAGEPYVTFHSAGKSNPKAGRDALDAALMWAKALALRGVGPRDRVLVLMPTGHAFVEALLGTMLLGAVPVPLATPMTFGSVDRYLENLVAVARDCQARATIAYPRIREAATRDPAVGAALGELLGEDSLDGARSVNVRLPSVGGADPAFLQYTSGTTGAPKGAIISHRAIVANAFSIAHGLSLGASDVGVSWLPLFHDLGLIGVLLTSLCHPYPVHVMSPRRWLELIARERGTISAAPNFAYDMCVARAGAAAGDLDLHTWRHALNGAEPVHAATAERFCQAFAASGLRGDVMMPVYGMAEATLAVTFSELDANMTTLSVDNEKMEVDRQVVPAADGRRVVSVGRPVAGVTVEIIGPSGELALERAVGEIRVSGPSLMDGYWGNESASSEALVGGWLRTGDLGFIDGGRLFVTGRSKELIIKGGRNIHPYDVERVAGEVEGVRAGGVAVFGRPNPATGTEDLVLVAETTQTDAERRSAIAKAVRAELLEVLGIKPDDIHFCGVGKVPRTTSGKIRRAECARIFTSGGSE